MSTVFQDCNATEIIDPALQQGFDYNRSVSGCGQMAHVPSVLPRQLGLNNGGVKLDFAASPAVAKFQDLSQSDRKNERADACG